MEWIQTFVPGRYGTVSDAVINTAGLATGVLTGYLLEKLVTALLGRITFLD
jgi:VanZ family protein